VWQVKVFILRCAIAFIDRTYSAEKLRHEMGSFFGLKLCEIRPGLGVPTDRNRRSSASRSYRHVEERNPGSRTGSGVVSPTPFRNWQNGRCPGLEENPPHGTDRAGLNIGRRRFAAPRSHHQVRPRIVSAKKL